MSRQVTRLIAGVLVLAGVLIARPLIDVPPGTVSPPPRPTLELSRSDGRTKIMIDDASTMRAELVDLVESLRSGALTVVGQRIEVSGIASASGDFRTALAAVQRALPTDAELELDVFVIDDGLDIDVLCQRMFDAVGNPTIAFQHAGSALRPSAAGALDRIVSFATACRERSIVIIGHSDAMGDAGYNRYISLRRARAVADYLVSRGVDENRLLVEGRGAAEPVADNDTIGGRARNRRIEFELR